VVVEGRRSDDEHEREHDSELPEARKELSEGV
jgi:hypothetical protein